MSKARCFLCAKTIKDDVAKFEIIEDCKVPSSKRPLQVVLQHLANCIKTKLVFHQGASVCDECFEELAEYDTLMIKLLTFQKKLTQQLQIQLTKNPEDDFNSDSIVIEVDEQLSDAFNPDLDTKEELIEIDESVFDEEVMCCETDENDFEGGSEEISVSSGGRKVRECVICGATFTSKTFLQNHITEVHDPKIYSCNICGVVRRDEEYLELHMNVHEGKTENECRFCGKTFSRPINTIRHMRKHWDKKKYQCEKCGERFSLDNMLYNHRLRHEAEENPLICSQCNQSFKSRKTFNHHILIHQENRPRHYCTLCNKSFTEKYTLKMHMKTHGSIIPLNTTSTKSSTVKEQQETFDAVTVVLMEKEEDQNCVICSVKFENKESLEEHLQNDHDVILK